MMMGARSAYNTTRAGDASPPTKREAGHTHTHTEEEWGWGWGWGRTASGATLGAAHKGHLSPPLTSCGRTAPSFTH